MTVPHIYCYLIFVFCAAAAAAAIHDNKRILTSVIVPAFLPWLATACLLAFIAVCNTPGCSSPPPLTCLHFMIIIERPWSYIWCLVASLFGLLCVSLLLAAASGHRRCCCAIDDDAPHHHHFRRCIEYRQPSIYYPIQWSASNFPIAIAIQ